jgi:hypothetical protein
VVARRSPCVVGARPTPDLICGAILKLQRTAGNAAVTALVRSQAARPVPVQRHSSFEHKLLGDVKPAALQIIVHAQEFVGPPKKPYDEQTLNVIGRDKLAAVHALDEQLKYLTEWQSAPPAPGTSAFHGVPVVTVKCEDEKAEVPCTIGEMNTLADYFANPEQIKHAKKGTLTGILQQVRQDTWGQLHKILEVLDSAVAAGSKPPTFAGAITSKEGFEKELAIEAFTADGRNKATQTYLSNAGRNACHFAPQSWYRSKDFHEQARGKAKQAYHAKHLAKGKDNPSLLKVAQDLANEAMVTSGFGDHYLQDSFAGGHLINKTLVMQWFVEWIGTQRDTMLDKLKAKMPLGSGSLIPEQSVGERWIRDWDKVKQMTASLQPKLAGIDLYDRPAGAVATDPQTVEEQTTRADRIKRAGLSGADQEKSYEAYLAMLNNPLIQIATKYLHDKFCAEGLVVAANGTYIGRVFGDDHMMKAGGNVAFSAETAQMSQGAITDLVREGKTEKHVETIMNRLPNEVTPPGGKTMIPLKDWATGTQLRTLCESEIFPAVLTTPLGPLKDPVLLGRSPAGSLGKISQDVPGGTEPSTDVQTRVRWVLEEIAAFKTRLPDFGAIKEAIAAKVRDLKAVGHRIVEGVGGAWSSLKSKAATAWSNIKGAVTGAAQDVGEAAGEAKEEVVKRYEKIRDELPDLEKDIESTVEDLERRLAEMPIPSVPVGAGMDLVDALPGGAAFGDASGGDF